MVEFFSRDRRRKVDEKSCVTFLLCDPGSIDPGDGKLSSPEY